MEQETGESSQLCGIPTIDISNIRIEDLPHILGGPSLKSLPEISSRLDSIPEDYSDSDYDYSDGANDTDEDLSDNQESEVKTEIWNQMTEPECSRAVSRKPPPRRVISRLPKSMKGLMGEANLRFARGEVDIAEKMCYEVIRQAPDAYEPYITLTQIYENRDPKKCEIFLTLATRLNRHDVTSWCRLAKRHVEQGKIKQAAQCYTSAVRSEPKNIELHRKRIQLAQQLGDVRFLLKCKVKMASQLPRRNHEEIISIIREVVPLYHENKMYEMAIHALEIPFKRIPKRVTQDLVNMMLELLLVTNKTSECLDIFTQFCNFEFELSVNDDNSISIDYYTMPEDTEVDIKSKFIICAVKLHSPHIFSTLIDALLVNYESDKIGDLFLDIAEALMAEACYEEALKLLVPLVKGRDYSLAAVWWKYAECLNKCGMYEQAIEAYFTVMALAPKHIEVLNPLSALLVCLGKKSEALEVMSSQNVCNGKLNVEVMVRQLELCKELGKIEEYFRTAILLLSRHCVTFRSPEECKIVMLSKKWDKFHKIKKMREFRGDATPVLLEVECIDDIDTQEEYELFKEIVQYARETKQYVHMQEITFMGMTSHKFSGFIGEIGLMALLSCIYNRDIYHGFCIARDLATRNMDNNHAWNLLNMVMQIFDEMRHTKFITRFYNRCSLKILEMMDANNELSVGTISAAVRFYMKEFKREPTPFVSFMLGVIVLQLYNQRHHIDKKVLAHTTVYIFLKYKELRSGEAWNEVCYNLGRMFQQLGITYMAEFYYNQVLQYNNRFIEEEPEVYCLKRETAFNLHLLYKHTGQLAKARRVLEEYLVI